MHVLTVWKGWKACWRAKLSFWMNSGSAAEGGVRLPNMPKVRICSGHSATEGATEGVLSSLPLHVLCDCFERF